MEAAVGVAYDPFAATEVTGELLAELPPAATIRAEEEFAALGITRVVLDNGVELFLKPTAFKDDQVLLSAISVGGLSVVEEEDLALASLAAGLVSASGAGGYSMTELEQLLANKMVAIKPSINNLDEGFGGAASPQDLETIFQLLYLYASAPQIDPNVANLYEREIANYLKNRALEPTAALEDKYLEIFCGDSLHCNYLLLFQQLDEIDPKAALTIFRERFSDLDDLKLVLVGSFDVEEAKRYAQQYLGALPAARGGEAWRDVRPALPAGIVEETVYAGIEARSEVNIYFSGEYSSTLENEVAVDMLVEILEGAITENLRGTRAGVYEVEVTSQTAASPSGRYELAIKFSAEPQRVEELKAAVFEEIALLHEYGPTASNYARVLRQFRRDHEENMLDNGTWMAWIIRFAVEQPGLLSEILRMDEVIEEVTPEDIQALARTLLPQDRHVTLILHPKDFADLDD
jgi:zinc protease